MSDEIIFSPEQLCGVEGCARVVADYDENEPCGLFKLGINIDHPHPLADACGVIRTIDKWEAEGMNFFLEGNPS